MPLAEVISTDPFQRRLDDLAEDYPSVFNEVERLIDQLEQQRPGDRIPNVGYGTYKVRLKNPDAGRGKSGGFRVIYYVRLRDRVVLLTIYTKSKQENIPAREIRRLIEDYLDDPHIEAEPDPS